MKADTQHIETKVCIGCNEEKPLTKFKLFYRHNRQYRYNECRACQDKRKSVELAAAAKERRYARRRKERIEGMNRASNIVHDTRGTDRKKGLDNDLTRPIVEDLLSCGQCSYCEDTTTILTLDRIDNTVGHVVTNVVVCCVRCNQIKNSMPYEAWLALVPRIKEVVKMGLFGDWVGGRRKHNK